MSSSADTITPLSANKQQLVIEETHAYIKQAANIYKIKNADIDITFDLTGRAAGMYRSNVKFSLIKERFVITLLSFQNIILITSIRPSHTKWPITSVISFMV